MNISIRTERHNDEILIIPSFAAIWTRSSKEFDILIGFINYSLIINISKNG